MWTSTQSQKESFFSPAFCAGLASGTWKWDALQSLFSTFPQIRFMVMKSMTSLCEFWYSSVNCKNLKSSSQLVGASWQFEHFSSSESVTRPMASDEPAILGKHLDSGSRIPSLLLLWALSWLSGFDSPPSMVMEIPWIVRPSFVQLWVWHPPWWLRLIPRRPKSPVCPNFLLFLSSSLGNAASVPPLAGPLAHSPRTRLVPPGLKMLLSSPPWPAGVPKSSWHVGPTNPDDIVCIAWHVLLLCCWLLPRSWSIRHPSRQFCSWLPWLGCPTFCVCEYAHVSEVLSWHWLGTSFRSGSSAATTRLSKLLPSLTRHRGAPVSWFLLPWSVLLVLPSPLLGVAVGLAPVAMGALRLPSRPLASLVFPVVLCSPMGPCWWASWDLLMFPSLPWDRHSAVGDPSSAWPWERSDFSSFGSDSIDLPNVSCISNSTPPLADSLHCTWCNSTYLLNPVLEKEPLWCSRCDAVPNSLAPASPCSSFFSQVLAKTDDWAWPLLSACASSIDDAKLAPECWRLNAVATPSSKRARLRTIKRRNAPKAEGKQGSCCHLEPKPYHADVEKYTAEDFTPDSGSIRQSLSAGRASGQWW